MALRPWEIITVLTEGAQCLSPSPPGPLEELPTIVEEMPNRYKLMVLLAAWCAMRFGELAELRRGDIGPRINRVKIRRGVRVDGEFIVGPPKSDAGVRDVATSCRW